MKGSDVVVHSVGVLIDAAIMGRAKPGDVGTYEQMNRDTAIKIANALEKIGDKKKRKIIYLSANRVEIIIFAQFSHLIRFKKDPSSSTPLYGG